MTYLCYVDESGTPEVPGTSGHFVLVGLAIPIDRWQEADRQITEILKRFGLEGEELHTAWMLRAYPEQSKIPDFERLDRRQRRSAVERYRAGELLRLRKLKSPKPHNQTKKNFAKTKQYTHLTRAERTQCINEVATCVASWDFAVVFVEAIDKIHFDPIKAKRSIEDQAFEQVISRFEQFLVRKGEPHVHGLIIHDNNETVAKKHTELMRGFHESGTLWSKINRINETPLFVDSKLTRMVQVADLFSYAVRRYVENQEEQLVRLVLDRVDMVDSVAVGARHYSRRDCTCLVCGAHSPKRAAKSKAAKSIAETGKMEALEATAAAVK